MKNRFKNNKQNILSLQGEMSVQDLYVQKSDTRFEIRIPKILKKLIIDTTKIKNTSYADLTIRLWLDYFSKTGKLTGKLDKLSQQELIDDINDFIERTTKKAG